MTSLLLLKSMLMANALAKSKRKKKKLALKSKPVEKNKTVNMRCRICDKEDGSIPIFNNLVHPNLAEEILSFSGVRIEDTDGIRKHMCQNCMELLNGCIMFREMCQKTNKKIIEMSIKKEVNMEITDCNSYPEYNEIEQAESDSSYNVPSPNYPGECMDLHCTYCNKDFSDMASYKTHRKQCLKNPLVSTKKKFLCDVCGKTSNSKATLLTHKTTHENNFPYECDKCPYKARHPNLLRTHKRSHLSESELPHRCTQCPKATTTASNLKRHMQSRHPNATKPQACKCTYCDKAFSFQHDMKRHIRDIHLRQSTVECEICLKKFNTKKILRGHLYRIHKIKGERHGRMPTYLQVQLEQPCDISGDNNINHNDDNEPEFM